jgi:hypothetical protein
MFPANLIEDFASRPRPALREIPQALADALTRVRLRGEVQELLRKH